jgi:hypothetical protein
VNAEEPEQATEEQEYRLAQPVAGPVAGPPPADGPSVPAGVGGWCGQEPAAPEPFQFSLFELLLLAVAVAFLLGILRMFPRNWGAFLAGMVALAGLVAGHVMKIERPIVIVAWWAFLAIYALLGLACILAGV